MCSAHLVFVGGNAPAVSFSVPGNNTVEADSTLKSLQVAFSENVQLVANSTATVLVYTLTLSTVTAFAPEQLAFGSKHGKNKDSFV